jgi:error-prone DNA polymerase
VRIGLGYVRGVRQQEVRQLVDTRREGGHFRGLTDLASRAGTASPSLELLAWSGACDSLVEGAGSGSDSGSSGTGATRAPGMASASRRIALWQLGVATPGHSVPGGTQLALPLELPAPPPLRSLSSWETMLADYSSAGLTTRTHPLALLRERLPADVVTSAQLATLRHGSRVRVGGMVVARQRPGTANGIVFILLEDEEGTINLIVPAKLYERERLIVRTEPLMLAGGKLERHPAAGGAINVLVDHLAAIAAPDQILADVKDFSMLDEQVRLGRLAQEAARQRHEGAESREASSDDEANAEDFRAVAPPVLSFASGRRR